MLKRMVVVVAACLGASAMCPAGAFVSFNSTLPGNGVVINYSVDANLTGSPYSWPVSMFDGGAAAWQAQGLAQQASLARVGYVTNHHVYGVSSIDGDSVARATNGCTSAGQCTMEFELQPSNNWNPTSTPMAWPWLDGIGFAAHEFGHWMGLSHSGDQPASDNHRPTMHAQVEYGDGARTITQDDMNGFRAARPTPNTNMVANGQFAFINTQYWGPGGALPGSMWMFLNRPCCISRYSESGNDFVQYNGNGGAYASIAQDIHIANGQWLAGSTLVPKARLRAQQGGSAQVVVWAGATAIYSRTCTGLGNAWIEIHLSGLCSGSTSFAEPTNTIPMRIEVYNLSATNNVDVDHVRIEF